MWNLEPPPEFQGLRDDLPLTVYFRHLPHWRQEGATYFVTFRLIDALPKAKQRELSNLRAEWAKHEGPPASFRDAVEWSTLKFKNHATLVVLYEEAIKRIDERLDEGAGSCLLNDHQAAGQSGLASGGVFARSRLQPGEDFQAQLRTMVGLPIRGESFGHRNA